MSLTSQLVEHLTKATFETLPAEVVDVAKHVCLDGIGVMIAGKREPLGLGRIAIDYARSIGGHPQSSVIGGGFKTSAGTAAYVNGTLAHALDWDNTWWPLNHPTSPTLPAILALAESNQLSGRDVILALVLAFEVQGRMRLASENSATGAGFHKPGVSGTMGATAAAGKLLGLDGDQYCAAFGIAGSRAGSLSVNTGTMTKSSHSGHAARMGIEAAQLAQLGWTAHPDIFGTGGFFDSFYGPGTYNLDLFLAGFANPYRMLDPGVGFKRYPSNYFTHRPIDAALEIVAKYALDVTAIETVEVDFPRFAYVNRPEPATGLDGKFSIQYATAVALLDGRIDLDSFSNERRFAPDVVNLLPRVKLIYRDEIPLAFPHTYAVVRVRLTDGRVHEARCDKPRGMWGVPLTTEERIGKFHACVGSSLSDEATAELIDLVDRLDTLSDVSRIMELAASAT